jgi:beta-N-acetylhexosaminidase
MTPSASPTTPAPSTSPASSPSASPLEPKPSPSTATPTPATASCAARTLASLTEAQRIGQIFVIGLIKDRLDAAERAGVAQYHFGSMTFTTQTSVGVAAVRTLTDAVQAQATQEATGGVWFFVAANQEGGLIQGLSGPGFDTIPSALVQGTMAPAVLQAKAARWGAQLRAAGINLNFAPVADVVPPGTDAENAPIGRLQREYGHDPATVSTHVAAFIAGMREAGIATTAKHFPGLGRVTGHTDFTANVVDSVTTRTDPYLAPFAKAVKSHVPFVMVSLATYERIDPAHLAVFSPTIIGGMLRGDRAFRGVVISDALGAAAVSAIPPGTRAVDFLGAGGDLIVVNQITPAIEMAKAVASLAAAKPSFRRRVDSAALRVLRAKEAAGLLPCVG